MRDVLLERLRLIRDGAQITNRNLIILVSYKGAVEACRQRDRDGLVTFEHVAKERRVLLETVYDFFERNPELRLAWQIIDWVELPKERCRAAARRLQAPIYRKALAYELGWKEKTLYAYLGNHPELVEELGVVYTPRFKNPLSTHSRHKKKRPAKL